MPRVAIIGARCRRQGIGEYVAASFARAGATVCAVAGTGEETNARTLRNLEERHDIRASAYVSVEALLEAEHPDIVAVCSPYKFHRRHLELVAAGGAHCLCEKPLWWGESKDRRVDTERLVDGFLSQRRYLGLVTQWPFTLPAFFSLHPGLRGRPLERFEMELSPARGGPQMVLDAAPHALSMMEALAGPGEVVAPRCEFVGGDRRNLLIRFSYRAQERSRTSAAEVDVVCRFATSEKPPRPAAYAINGHKVRRRIELKGYHIYFETEERSVVLEDPLQLLVNDFLGKVATGVPVARQSLIGGIGALELLCSTVVQGVQTQPSWD